MKLSNLLLQLYRARRTLVRGLRLNNTAVEKAWRLLFTPNLTFGLAISLGLAGALATCGQTGFAQSNREYHRTLAVAVSEAVTLDVRLPEADLQFVYRRNDQVSITAFAQDLSLARGNHQFSGPGLAVEQQGNHVQIRNQSGTAPSAGKIRITCRIDVPYWTEVSSSVDNGNQTITGIMGPVKAETARGDIKVSYVSKSVAAVTGTGNLELRVISGRIAARTVNGNISCIRAVQGATAEAENGNIVLMVVGPS